MTTQATTKRSPKDETRVAEPPALGRRLRQLRKAKQLTLRELADRVNVGFTYLSKIENGKLEEGHFPSDQLLDRLAMELEADSTELMLLAEKIPEPIRQRVIAQPEAFRVLASLGDDELRALVKQVGRQQRQRARLRNGC